MKPKSTLPTLAAIVALTAACATCKGVPVAGYSGVDVGDRRMFTDVQSSRLPRHQTLPIKGPDGKVEYLEGKFYGEGCFMTGEGAVYRHSKDSGWKRVYFGQ